jgi:mannan endo-1,4-beta-mannosidase
MDFEANLKLSNIDFGTFHLYPEAWGETPAEEWGLGYIQAHINSM